VGWDFANIENQPAFRKEAKETENPRYRGWLRQNGFTTTRMTAPIIKMVGTSLIIR
jgi:hypothetical protein